MAIFFGLHVRKIVGAGIVLKPGQYEGFVGTFIMLGCIAHTDDLFDVEKYF